MSSSKEIVPEELFQAEQIWWKAVQRDGFKKELYYNKIDRFQIRAKFTTYQHFWMKMVLQELMAEYHNRHTWKNIQNDQ